MIVCTRCNKENQDHYKFCLGCGSELPRESASKASAAGASAGGGGGGGRIETPVYERQDKALEFARTHQGDVEQGNLGSQGNQSNQGNQGNQAEHSEPSRPGGGSANAGRSGSSANGGAAVSARSLAPAANVIVSPQAQAAPSPGPR